MNAPAPLQPDVIDAGRVLATLNDWRAIMFVLVFIIVFQQVFLIWREISMNIERKAMRDLAASFAQSASEVSHALSDLSTKIAVLSALTARAEAYISKAGGEEK